MEYDMVAAATLMASKVGGLFLPAYSSWFYFLMFILFFSFFKFDLI